MCLLEGYNEPQAVLLRSIVDRQLVLFDELLPLARREAERVAVALELTGTVTLPVTDRKTTWPR
jgi:hypothetical protein